jgi:hypothetical protein
VFGKRAAVDTSIAVVAAPTAGNVTTQLLQRRAAIEEVTVDL